MKIIPTWPRASLRMFHETALQDCSNWSNPEDPLGQLLVAALLAM